MRWLLQLFIGMSLLSAACAEETLSVWQSPNVVTLREAQFDLQVRGQVQQGRTTLPYQWDRMQPAEEGNATFTFNFVYDSQPGQAYALFAPKLGNAYEISLNGALLQRNGELRVFNEGDYSKVPRFIAIPQGLLRSVNTLEVAIRADVGRRSGLAPLYIGPDSALYPMYLSEYRWRSTGTVVVVTFSLLVGIFSLAVWATQVKTGVRTPLKPMRDRLYLLAGIAELFWAVRVGDAITENPVFTWPVWGVVVVSALFAWAYAMAAFCLELGGWVERSAAVWLQRWLGVLLAFSVPSAFLALSRGDAWLLTATYAALALTFALFVPVFLYQAYRVKDTAPKWVAIAVLANVVVGSYDLFAFRLSGELAKNTYMRYSSLLFGLALIYVVIRRFRDAAEQSHHLTATLEDRISQKEQDLRRSYQRLEAMAREQERVSERTRIVRDFHDGVGSHISVAIRQLESEQFDRTEVLATMHESLDLLKLSIDSMNLPAGDVTALLANLRYRLEPRLKASGISLQWDVDLIPVVPRLADSEMRHLLYILYGALSNVLQHANATQLNVRATEVGAQLEISLTDNGVGFDTSLPGRNGLLHMRERALVMVSQLEIHSVPGETRVTLKLPMEI